MGQVKKLLIEAESLLVTCLDDWGMTNDEEFAKIRKQLGSMVEDHVRKLVNKWNKEDKNGNSTIQ